MSRPAAAPEPVIVGVRHHSPACARLVADRITRLRPAHVLIEGPADVNDRIGELLLGHTPPVAVFSYLSGETEGARVHRASWTPLCDYSPEWQAVTVGARVGAQVRFIDLPAWHEAMWDVTDRYADEADPQARHRQEQYSQALCARLGVDSHDAAWDQLFEDDATAPDELAETLGTYFEHLRDGDPGSLANAERESMMARWIAWAVAQDDGPVLVVCGGYHAPALARLWRGVETGEQPPPVPAPPVGGVRYGSYLVPYRFDRLDTYAGYGAGMPSPGYYQWVWDDGVEQAGQQLIRQVVDRLRGRDRPASTAHLVAVHARAQALARVRAHRVPLRTDWLDAIVGTLVQDALDVPVPWSYRGPLRPGTDPVLVETVDALTGTRVGVLAPGTPQPPLVAAVREELSRHRIGRGTHVLDLHEPADGQRSRVLHRLRLLQIPGAVLAGAPRLRLAGDRTETWRFGEPHDQESALVEAGGYGATPVSAATAKLTELLQAGAGDAEALAGALNLAALAGLSQVHADVLPRLRERVGAESRLESLGRALGVLLPLRRYGQEVPGELLATVVDATVDRALWLLEPAATVDTGSVAAHLDTLAALRDVTREALADPGLLPQVPADRLVGVLIRKAADPASDPVSRGGALGALADLAPLLRPTDDMVARSLDLVSGVPAVRVGDALAGLIRVGREALIGSPVFLTGVDAVLRQLSGEDFVLGLPGLRGAFAWLPSTERGRLADEVLRLHGRGGGWQLTGQLAADPLAGAAAWVAEQAALAELARWGVLSEGAG